MAQKVREIILSSILTAILMLPYLGSFSHLFEDHDHKTCQISQTHLHELELECDILDYQFAPSIDILYETSFTKFITSQQKKFTSFNLGDSFSIDAIEKLRGPPNT